MRLIYALVLLTGFALPARANDAALKKEVEQLANSYMACFDKKDPSCIAGLYTSDGIMINAAGVHNKGPLDAYPGLFQAGFTKLVRPPCRPTPWALTPLLRRARTISLARIRRAWIWSPMGHGPPPTSETAAS